MQSYVCHHVSALKTLNIFPWNLVSEVDTKGCETFNFGSYQPNIHINLKHNINWDSYKWFNTQNTCNPKWTDSAAYQLNCTMIVHKDLNTPFMFAPCINSIKALFYCSNFLYRVPYACTTGPSYYSWYATITLTTSLTTSTVES
jgi:hypothetical protein